jgi:hypothetical protein
MPIIGSFSGATAYGRSGGRPAVTAFGGTIYTSGDYTIHAFTYNSGTAETFSVASVPPDTKAEIVVIGGGGAGGQGYNASGGGGAGGLTYMPPIVNLSNGNSWTITVGAGAAITATGNHNDSSSTALSHGRPGENTTCVTTNNGTLTGGGGGGGNESYYYSSSFKDGLGNGGSGGGGGDWWSPQRGGGTASRAAAYAGGYRLGDLSTNGAYHYGNDGGSRDLEDGAHAGPHEGSGGGGATGQPTAYGEPYDSSTPAAGGRGLYLPQYDVSGLGSPNGYFAGGGGGGSNGSYGSVQTNDGYGGYYGGGGLGRRGTGDATAGVDGTGGGGGGGAYTTGGKGGNGIVLIRYKTTGGAFDSYGNGSAQNRAARSASHILAANPSATSGFYWIESYGVAKQVYCDMTNEGGGWMLMSCCGTDIPYCLHVLDNPWNESFNVADIGTLPASGQGCNMGQLFIDGLVRRARGGGFARFNINGNLRYFPTNSTSEWAPVKHRSGNNFQGLEHNHPGNQWLKSCYTAYTADTGSNGAGTISGTNVTWGSSTWGTFPYNMSGNDGNNFGYSIDTYYASRHLQIGDSRYLSAHASGWNRAASLWLKIGASV